MIRRCLIALAIATMACTAPAQDRDANLKGLMQVYADAGDDIPALMKKTREFLVTLSKDDAMNAEGDLLVWGFKNKALTRLQYARSMLELNQSYAPDNEPVLDYWRYVVMLAAKHERGEIAIEEYQYLEARKLAEAKAADRPSVERYRRPAPSAPEPQRVEAQIDPVGPMLQAVGRALRRPGATSTNCVTTGSSTSCYSR